jgi:hypothetical protein
MKAHFLLLIAVAPTAFGAAAQAQDVDVPEGVRYKYAAEALNAKARDKALVALSQTDAKQGLQTLFGTRLICGPYLWEQIKSEPEMAAVQKGRVIFKIPVRENGNVTRTDEKEGKLFQSPEEIAMFSKAFAKIYDYEERRKVRKLTAPELGLHWSMISWDITEPIFIVESKSRRILLAFAARDLSVRMIDDYQLLGPGSATLPAAEQVEIVELNQVRLYVPIPQLRDRFGETEALANYVKSLQRATATVLSKEEQLDAKGLLLAVGIKSKRNTRVWCQAVEGEVPTEVLQRLEMELAKVVGVDLKKGPAGFALEMNLSGQKPENYPQFPDLWLEAARNSPNVKLVPPDELFKKIWPD